MVEIPPFTISFNFTFNSTSKGKSKSTREPNFIKPHSSVCLTSVFSFPKKTIRLAKAPAICLNKIALPWLSSTTMVVLSFSVDAFGCQATKYFRDDI